MSLDQQSFGESVAEACAKSGVVGMTMAASLNGHTVSAARGILNVETGVEVRPDSLFQIGSVTKSLTSTLIMQAADEGLIDIDAPVKEIIPLPLGKGEYSGRFTARQLMSHLSGLDGDMFLDTGRDDDALAKYMVLCADLEFLSPPGRYYNYCNAGYSILGRMLEIVRHKTYDQVLGLHLFAPLNAPRSTTFAEEAALRRCAVGHNIGADGKPVLVPQTPLPHALGPAGLTLYSTSEELIAYANAHLAGEKLITRKSVAAMQTPHAELAENAVWGLGWKMFERGGVKFVGHEGGTIGQVGSLCLVPQAGLAVAMCANGGDAGRAWEKVMHPIFRDVCGEVPEIPVSEPLSEPVDLAPFEGAYENAGIVMHISVDGDRLKIVAKHKFFSQPDTIFHMRPLGGDRFRATIGSDDKVITAFYDRDTSGKPNLFYAGRIHRRIRT